jgi:ATP-dependent RNA helicase DeaD
MVRLYLASGSKAGMRPADIVGAIASDADVPGKSIGAIDIFDNYAFVDLPDQYVERVIGKNGQVTIRGRAVDIRVSTVADGPSRRARPAPPTSGGSDRGAPRRASTGMARKRPDSSKGGSYRASSRGAPGIKKRRD